MTHLQIEAKTVEPNQPIMREGWISGVSDDQFVSFDLDTTFGQPFLVLYVRVDGETIRERLDVRELTQKWVEAILAVRKDDDGA